jgi:hypothetical protein
LVKNKILDKNNEVYIKYEEIIDNVLAGLKENPKPAIFAAISPNERDKYLIKLRTILF